MRVRFLPWVAIGFFLAAGSVNADSDCETPIGPETALESGISAIFAAHAGTAYSSVDGRTLGPVTYLGIEDFLARNPDCCSFSTRGEDGFAPTPEWQEKNSFYGFVSATFKAYYTKDGDTLKEVATTNEVAITTCGKAIWYNIDHDNW
ncbi:MAG: hypothetical protein V4516_12865 [Pseudomonadota bacterium]